jgi:hypothetical protein
MVPSFYRPMKFKTFCKYALEETEQKKLLISFKDVHRKNLDRVIKIIKRLSDVEIYVACLEEWMGYDLTRIVRVKDLKQDWQYAIVNTRVSIQDMISAPIYEIDNGYRTAFLLIPKTKENLVQMKKRSGELGVPIPEFYRKDFDALQI